MNREIHSIQLSEAAELLSALIRTPSFSRQEQDTARLLNDFFSGKGIKTQQHLNNVWAFNRNFDPSLPTLLLNSHHDTVLPNSGYTRDPFDGKIEADKLFGLGSNDAGASLVALLFAFLHFFEKEGLSHNLVFAATAEEEISGTGGIESILPLLPKIDCAIVGEPTKLQLAVAERGLVVLDVQVKGRAGHAARAEGDNALYKALSDIAWIKNHSFEKVSEWLGPVQMTVTSIDTDNKAHNVVPAHCHFIVDVRVNDCYTPEEIVATIQGNISGTAVPRSLRLRPSAIPVSHPLVQAGRSLGKECYGSPTSSDKSLMPFPALKMGPGDSARSHMSDEFVFISELQEGIDTYIQLLNQVV